MFSVNYLRSINLPFRALSTSKCLAKNHYNSLGIEPTATQADIKDAYYKLSMLYHPDKTKEEDDITVQKFRDITEAYEILGNVRLRRLYDKGVSDIADDTVNKFYKSREKRSAPSTGRTPIYDFDEWSKQHYGVMFAKEQEFKRKVKVQKQAARKEAEVLEMGRIIFVMMIAFAALAYYAQPTYDRVHIRNKSPSDSE